MALIAVVLRKIAVQFLFSLIFAFAQASAETVKALCSNVVRSQSEILKDQKFWERKISESYRKAHEQWYSITTFFDFGGPPTPVNPLAYRLADRLKQKEHHSVLAQQHLGFELVQDQYGREALRPPKSLKALLKHIDDWKKQLGLSSSSAPELIFLFVDKKHKELPESLDEYVIVKASEPGLWPDRTRYKNVSDIDSVSQLPSDVFIELLALGQMQVPAKEFLDHEVSHLTEMLSQSRSYMENLIGYGQALVRNPELKRHKTLREREAALLEYFTLPDLTKSQEIKDFLAQFRIGSTTSVTRVSHRILRDLNSMSSEALVAAAARFADQVRPLIYRQGGGMRDSHNMYDQYKDRYVTTYVLNETGFNKEPLRLTEKDDRFGKFASESLVAYLNQINVAAYELSQPRLIQTTVFNLAHNRVPSIKISPEKYQQMLKRFIALRMARVIKALSVGIDLNLTPAQTFKEGLTASIDPNSPLIRYLDAYLPRFSFLRTTFEVPDTVDR